MDFVDGAPLKLLLAQDNVYFPVPDEDWRAMVVSPVELAASFAGMEGPAQQLADAITQWGEAATEIISGILSGLAPGLSSIQNFMIDIDPWWGMADDEIEAARRSYAKTLNVGRIRKISWRRLNRPQQVDAAFAWRQRKQRLYVQHH